MVRFLGLKADEEFFLGMCRTYLGLKDNCLDYGLLVMDFELVDGAGARRCFFYAL